MENLEIRLKARGAGIALWQIADRMKVSEATITRMLRRPLDKETKQKILNAINAIKSERDAK